VDIILTVKETDKPVIIHQLFVTSKLDKIHHKCFEYFNGRLTEKENPDETVKIISKIFDKLVENASSEYVLNVNIPNVCESEIKGVVFCKAGVCKYSDGYVSSSEGVYKLIGEPIPPTEKDIGTDVYYSYNNFVTVSPLTPFVTNEKALEKLKDIKF
jgi:broad specificity polyphosphatase/5'/3'-nucleotidase SurE